MNYPYPQCPDCRGFSVRTAEWVRWTDNGPRVVSYLETPAVPDWCEDCEGFVSAEWCQRDETELAPRRPN